MASCSLVLSGGPCGRKRTRTKRRRDPHSGYSCSRTPASRSMRSSCSSRLPSTASRPAAIRPSGSSVDRRASSSAIASAAYIASPHRKRPMTPVMCSPPAAGRQLIDPGCGQARRGGGEERCRHQLSGRATQPLERASRHRRAGGAARARRSWSLAARSASRGRSRARCRPGGPFLCRPRRRERGSRTRTRAAEAGRRTRSG